MLESTLQESMNTGNIVDDEWTGQQSSCHHWACVALNYQPPWLTVEGGTVQYAAWLFVVVVRPPFIQCSVRGPPLLTCASKSLAQLSNAYGSSLSACSSLYLVNVVLCWTKTWTMNMYWNVKNEMSWHEVIETYSWNSRWLPSMNGPAKCRLLLAMLA